VGLRSLREAVQNVMPDPTPPPETDVEALVATVRKGIAEPHRANNRYEYGEARRALATLLIYFFALLQRIETLERRLAEELAVTDDSQVQRELKEEAEAKIETLERERDVLFKGDWAALNLRVQLAEAKLAEAEAALERTHADQDAAMEYTAQLEAQVETLTNKLNADSQNFELECRKAQVETLERERDEARELAKFVHAIEAAHEQHLRTGDYTALGIAAQDALRSLRGET
jgi:hypothetical protein